MSTVETRRKKPTALRRYQRFAANPRQEVTQRPRSTADEPRSNWFKKGTTKAKSARALKWQAVAGKSRVCEKFNSESKPESLALSLRPFPKSNNPDVQNNTCVPTTPRQLHRHRMPMWLLPYAQGDNSPTHLVPDGMPLKHSLGPFLHYHHNDCVEPGFCLDEPLFMHGVEPTLSLGIEPIQSQLSTTLCSTAIPSSFDILAHKPGSWRSSCGSSARCQSDVAETRPGSSAGISSNILNSSTWQQRPRLNQRQKQQCNRDSRVQSIAATGRDIRYLKVQSIHSYTAKEIPIKCSSHRPTLDTASEYAGSAMSAAQLQQLPTAPVAGIDSSKQANQKIINVAPAELFSKYPPIACSHHV
ncbi:hypothetical protein GGH92_010322, partial [Coemansia sp. RSA 2673]